tara:strand:+ start:65 stop:304 length:240 start_codon:yes stop_codon:yes gene_type:complete
MKIISHSIDDNHASVVAVDDDYVYVVDATPNGSRWNVHLVISLGDDVVYDDTTHDQVNYDCPDFWFAYMLNVPSYRAYI